MIVQFPGFLSCPPFFWHPPPMLASFFLGTIWRYKEVYCNMHLHKPPPRNLLPDTLSPSDCTQHRLSCITSSASPPDLDQQCKVQRTKLVALNRTQQNQSSFEHSNFLRTEKNKITITFPCTQSTIE